MKIQLERGDFWMNWRCKRAFRLMPGKEGVGMQEFSFILGADMNTSYLSIDRSNYSIHHSQNVSSKSSTKLMDDFSLMDTFRVINPTMTLYSFCSNRHKSYSRIDYIIISASLIAKIHSATILPTPLSDHNIVLSKITIKNTPKTAVRWHFNSSLCSNDVFAISLKMNYKDI